MIYFWRGRFQKKETSKSWEKAFEDIPKRHSRFYSKSKARKVIWKNQCFILRLGSYCWFWIYLGFIKNFTRNVWLWQKRHGHVLTVFTSISYLGFSTFSLNMWTFSVFDAILFCLKREQGKKFLNWIVFDFITNNMWTLRNDQISNFFKTKNVFSQYYEES